MNIKKVWVFLILLLGASQSGYSMIVINEFLADPPAGLLGDANDDGVRSSSGDEFIELLNTGLLTVNLNGWSLSDASSQRHQFTENLELGSDERIVIFGGGSLNTPYLSVAASSGLLSLNNTADSLFLRNDSGIIIHQVTYGNEANQNQSLVMTPEGFGSYHLHSEVSSTNLPFSPGANLSGEFLQNVPTAPEASSFILMIVGLGVYFQMKNQNAKEKP